MSKREPYYIVKSLNIHALEREIVRLMSYGYVPCGNLIYDGKGYLQPMIDRTVNSEKEIIEINIHDDPQVSGEQYS